MEAVPRKMTYRLYPNATQTALLETSLALPCRVYNTLLEKHKRRFDAQESAFGFSAMCKALTPWRGLMDALQGLRTVAPGDGQAGFAGS